MGDRRRRRQADINNDVVSEGESQEADQLSADSAMVCCYYSRLVVCFPNKIEPISFLPKILLSVVVA